MSDNLSLSGDTINIEPHGSEDKFRAALFYFVKTSKKGVQVSIIRIGKTRVSLDLIVAFVATASLVTLSLVYGGSPHARSSNDKRPALRLAYFPNLTHAPALVGIARGDFQRELPGYFIEPKVVNAGPDAMEALLAGEVDVAYVGPSPAVNTYLKSGGKALKILAGCCSGGASLIARNDEEIHTVADLDHKRVAVPQLGGTQDVSLRHFLDLNHLAPEEKGGTVQIIPVKNPDILALFLQRQIDAAWVPEPWASRLKKDAHAKTVADERDLWPGNAFTTTVIVARSAFVKQHPDAIQGILRAHLADIAWLNTHEAEGQKIVNSELKRLTGKGLTAGVLTEAWNHLSFTDDPNRENITALAEAAEKAGYLKGNLNLDGAFDTIALASAKQQRRLEAR